MKLPVAKANAFAERPDKSFRLYLVYGPDSGMVRENALKLLKAFVPDLSDPFSVSAVEASTIAKDPSRLFDEMASQSLLGGRRVLHVQDAGDEIFPMVDRLLKELPPGESVAVVEAGALEKRSKLRTRVEGEEGAAAWGLVQHGRPPLLQIT